MELLGRQVGNLQPLFLIAGPCVVEGERLMLSVAGTLKGIAERLGLFFIFKSTIYFN